MTISNDTTGQYAGLSETQAKAFLQQIGPNALPDVSRNVLSQVAEKFWAPVPFMLEVTIVIELFLGRHVEAAIIAALLIFNAALGMLHEKRAQATLAALRSRLALNASVKRDGRWQTRLAADLVPGDLIKLSLGAVVPADARLTAGDVLVDQSMLTGESAPVEAETGVTVFSGALVRRGEAEAVVTATGSRTRFGKTAELVNTAHVVSSEQQMIMRVVRNLALFNGLVIAATAAYGFHAGMPLVEIGSLVLTAMLASIPVALPATFTLAAAIGARSLARQGVLPTRLSAVDEAATMDVLCSDKTGTLTRNTLRVVSAVPAAGNDVAHLLGLAALASSDGGQDPVDAAIRAAASSVSPTGLPVRDSFKPFDPATKSAEAVVHDAQGNALMVVKGAYATLSRLAAPDADLAGQAEALEEQGHRVMAVAAGPSGQLSLIGLIALSDPPRDDAARLIAELRTLGVRTLMITGDAARTAAVVARAVGLDGKICPPGPLPQNLQADTYAVYASVLPEDKFNLVHALQASGHTVGMCGDGANDAPALRQAHMGIAVAQATDVAKSAAGMVLTEPGLAGIVAAVREGRTAFQRIQTYALNSIIKKIVTVLFIAIGLLLTGHPILTPLLMVTLLVCGDFLAMSITTDNVHPSSTPDKWRIGGLTEAGAVLGIAQLVFSVLILVAGHSFLEIPADALPKLAFVTLVFGSQASIYSIRERGRLLTTRPSFWLVASSLLDIGIATAVALSTFGGPPMTLTMVAGLLGAAVVFGFVLDGIKRSVINRFVLELQS